MKKIITIALAFVIAIFIFKRSDVYSKYLVEVRLDLLKTKITNMNYDESNMLVNASLSIIQTSYNYQDMNDRLEQLLRLVKYINNGKASVIDPCGNQYLEDELLIQLSNGKIVSLFYDQIFEINAIKDGTYITSDGQRCSFTIKNGEYFKEELL